MPRRRELHDHYFLKAKAEGYVARSAYKLLQIQERRRLIRRGDYVLDLGCAPGSWLQVASKLVAAHGRVVGIDLQATTCGPLDNVRTIEGDIFQTDAATFRELVGAEQPADPDAEGQGPFDALLSDMAANTTGAGDHFRSVALCRRVLALAPLLLRPGGVLCMKVFEGEAYPALLAESAELFVEAKGYKPDATRDVSPEMYIVAYGFHGQGPAVRGLSGVPGGGPPKPRPGWGTP